MFYFKYNYYNFIFLEQIICFNLNMYEYLSLKHLQNF